MIECVTTFAASRLPSTCGKHPATISKCGRSLRASVKIHFLVKGGASPNGSIQSLNTCACSQIGLHWFTVTDGVNKASRQATKGQQPTIALRRPSGQMFWIGTWPLDLETERRIVGAIVFFFGKDKVKAWLNLGKEMKESASSDTPSKSKKKK